MSNNFKRINKKRKHIPINRVRWGGLEGSRALHPPPPPPSPPPPRCCKYLHRVSLDGGRATPYLTIFPRSKSGKGSGVLLPHPGVVGKFQTWNSIASRSRESLLLPSCNKSECNHPRTKTFVFVSFAFQLFLAKFFRVPISFRSVEHCTENRNCFFVSSS